MLGVRVDIEAGKEVVTPRPNGLSDGQLSTEFATRVFTALCGYRVVDVLGLIGGVYPSATLVERTAAPQGPLQVCTLTASHCEELILGFSVSLRSKIGSHY
jgi:hypothetical protein